MAYRSSSPILSARRLGASLLVVAAALLASGCVTMSQSGSHARLDAPVLLESTHCVTGLTGSDFDGCDGAGLPVPFDDFASGELQVQLMLAYQVPNALRAPARITSSGAEAVTFERSASYTAELDRVTPDVTGRTWVGYISAPITLDALPVGFSVAAPFTLAAGNQPASVSTRVTSGFRVIVPDSVAIPPEAPTGVARADSPVRCVDLLELVTELGDDTMLSPDDVVLLLNGAFCSADLIFREMAAGADAPPKLAELNDLPATTTRLFGATVEGADVDVVAGSSGSSTFTVQGAAPAGASQQLDAVAVTNLRGATVRLDRSRVTIKPGSRENLKVTVSAPAAALPDSYTLTLQLKDGAKVVRSAAVAVRVAAAPAPKVETPSAAPVTAGGATPYRDTTPPRLNRLVLGKRINRFTFARHGIRARVGQSEKVGITVTLSRRVGKRWIRSETKTARLNRHRVVQFRLKPTQRSMRLYGKRGTRLLRVQFTLTDRAGNRTVISRIVRLV